MGTVSAAPGDPGVGDRQIVDRGTRESEWGAWKDLQHMAAIDATELVPAGRRIVVLAPHPDDEVLGTGGLLATLAPLRDVLIVGVTDGDASHPHSRLWPRAALIEARLRERQAGLACLGITKPAVQLGFDDGAVSKHVDKLAMAIGDRLHAGDVVFAPWRFDGHPDHEATGRAAQEACATRRVTLIEVPIEFKPYR